MTRSDTNCLDTIRFDQHPAFDRSRLEPALHCDNQGTALRDYSEHYCLCCHRCDEFALLFQVFYRRNKFCLRRTKQMPPTYQRSAFVVPRLVSRILLSDAIVRRRSLSNTYPRVSFQNVAFHYQDGVLRNQDISMHCQRPAAWDSPESMQLVSRKHSVGVDQPSSRGTGSLGSLVARKFDIYAECHATTI